MVIVSMHLTTYLNEPARFSRWRSQFASYSTQIQRILCCMGDGRRDSYGSAIAKPGLSQTRSQATPLPMKSANEYGIRLVLFDIIVSVSSQRLGNGTPPQILLTYRIFRFWYNTICQNASSNFTDCKAKYYDEPLHTNCCCNASRPFLFETISYLFQVEKFHSWWHFECTHPFSAMYYNADDIVQCAIRKMMPVRCPECLLLISINSPCDRICIAATFISVWVNSYAGAQGHRHGLTIAIRSTSIKDISPHSIQHHSTHTRSVLDCIVRLTISRRQNEHSNYVAANAHRECFDRKQNNKKYAATLRHRRCLR